MSNTTAVKTGQISEAARTALLAVPGREGAVIEPLSFGREVRAELSVAGLIGPAYGLTRRGVIQRARMLEALLDDAF